MLRGLFAIAKKVGFSGIGIYPDWKPYLGMHLDVRADRSADNPATWSGIRTSSGQKYFGIERAFS